MTIPLKACLYALALTLASGCDDRPPDATTARGAVAIANAYMADNLPQVDLNRRKISASDLGDKWQVTYDLPEGGTGGPIIFLVDKRRAEVVDGEIMKKPSKTNG